MKQMTVFVMEDLDADKSFVGNVLRGAGHLVTQLRDGKEGLRLALDAVPNLLLVDLLLPGLSGFEVLRRYRMAGGGAPYIMMSALDSPEHSAYAAALGANRYLVKPFSAETLLREVAIFGVPGAARTAAV